MKTTVRDRASNAVALGLIPGQETKITYAMRQKKKKRKLVMHWPRLGGGAPPELVSFPFHYTQVHFPNAASYFGIRFEKVKQLCRLLCK